MTTLAWIVAAAHAFTAGAGLLAALKLALGD